MSDSGDPVCEGGSAMARLRAGMDTFSAAHGIAQSPQACMAQADDTTPDISYDVEHRGLLQSSTSPIEVSTASALLTAVKQGAKDIIITDHMDLTKLSLKETGICDDGCESPLGPISQTRSIRGDCEGASIETLPTLEPPLTSLRGKQCVLLGQDDILAIVSPNLWLDSLYLRALFENGMDGVDREDAFISLVGVAPDGVAVGTKAVYMTNMTFQGDNAGPTVGLFADERTYIEDSDFLHLGGSELSYCPICTAAVAARSPGTGVSLKSCSFRLPFEAPGSRYIRAFAGGSVRTEDCSFGNATKAFLADPASALYSDDPTLEVEVISGQAVEAPTPLEDIPEPAAGDLPLFLSRDDQWFAELRNELTGEPLPPALAPSPAPAPAPAPEEAAGPGTFPILDFDPASDQRVLPPPPEPPAPTPTPTPEPFQPAVAGSIAACAAALLAIAAFVVYRIVTRSESREGKSADARACGPPMSAAATSSHPSLSYPQIWGVAPGSVHASSMHGSTHGSMHGSMHGSAHPWHMRTQSLPAGADSFARPPSQAGSAFGRDTWTISAPADMPPGAGLVPHGRQGSMHSNIDSLSASHSQHRPIQSAYGSTSRVNQITADTFEMMDMGHQGGVAGANQLQAPPDSAPLVDRLEFLHSQLDTFGAHHRLMNRFHLLGLSLTTETLLCSLGYNEKIAGQGLVAFARGVHDQLDYAIKFILNQSSLAAELALYGSRTLGPLLPQIEVVYDPADVVEKLTDARGAVLPAFIVMERGESLSDWSERAKPDIFQSVAVLVHVATRLRDMHAAEYVHRDVKPGNIMLLPRKNSWTVIDFGCTARTGEPAPLSFTVQYAPPEVIDAYLAKHKFIVATEAMDAWAMGVVAFELLTGTPAFAPFTPKEKIMRQLQGEEQLPWEGQQNSSVVRKKLGIFRQPIMSLLQRAPADRSSLAVFCNACQQVFSSTSTVCNHTSPRYIPD